VIDRNFSNPDGLSNTVIYTIDQGMSTRKRGLNILTELEDKIAELNELKRNR